MIHVPPRLAKATTMWISLVLVLLAALVSPTSVHAQTWGAHGPDGTSIAALASSYWNPHVLYAGTATQGVFRTTNGGAHWEATALTSVPVTSLAVDPYSWTTVYAGTKEEGIFKSTDGGATWRAVNDGLSGVEYM